MAVVAYYAVVETGIDIEFAGYPAVELEVQRVLPFYLRTFIGGIGEKTRLPLYVVREDPLQVDRHLRTDVILGVVPRINTITFGQ